jgi:tetratricopeptide (TPR) repeat protein
MASGSIRSAGEERAHRNVAVDSHPGIPAKELSMSAWHDQHPDHEALERFLTDRLSEADGRAVERHLFVCRECEKSLLRLLPLPEGARSRGPAVRGSATESGAQAAVRKLVRETRSAAHRRRPGRDRERLEATELWRQLSSLDPAERSRRLAAEPRFHTWGLFELLLETALQSNFAEPRRAAEELRLALELSDRLDPEPYGPAGVAAAKARAWAYLAASLRILSDFRQAEQALAKAERCFTRSWRDPLDEALLLEVEGSLRRAQRRFDESIRLLDGAVGLYRNLNEPHLHGRALMTKGLVLQYNGDFAAATGCFRDSLRLLDGAQEPRLVVATQFNLINCLFDSGRVADAAALIPAARRLMERAGTPSDRLHLRWLEAQMAAARGRSEEAERTLLEVKEAFSAASAAFDAALVTLELATLYARDGRTADVKPLAEEIIPIFQSCEVPQEALAAVIVLHNAAEREQITLGLVEEVSAFLARVRTNPGLRFRGEDEAGPEGTAAD